MKRMTWMLWLLAAAGSFLPVRAAIAQTKTAVLDIATIFEKYDRTAYLEEEFLQKRKFLSEEADRRRQQVETLRKALTDAYKPGTPEYKQKQSELREAEVRFKAWGETEDENLKDAHKQSLLEIYDDVRTVVATLAKEKGIDLVLTYDRLTESAPDSESLRRQILLQKVLYYNPTLDITDAALAALNEQFRKKQSSQPRTGDAAGKSGKPAGNDPPKQSGDVAKPTLPKPGDKPAPSGDKPKPAPGKP